MSEQSILEPGRSIPVIEEVDVVVAGGGPGGVPAAIAAARTGASVLIIEHYGFLGGLATTGMIGPLFGYSSAQTDDRILGGIPVEVIRELQMLGGAPDKGQLQWGAIPFEPEMFKHAVERLALAHKNIRFLLHTSVVATVRDGNSISHIIVESKSGRAAVKGAIFIDATGDGDVAALAGCSFSKGRPADGLTQSMGTKFRIGGIRRISVEEEEKNNEVFRQAIREKRVPAYHIFAGEISAYGATLRDGEDTPTVTRVTGDGTNVYDLTAGEIKLRADTLKIVDFCRKNLSGFEKCYLMATPAQIGVRETRQITGLYTLTGKECVTATKFADGIARGSWFMDIHCPFGLYNDITNLCSARCAVQPDCRMKKQYRDQLYPTVHLDDGTYYDIPYGCLVARDVENLLVSGRCISADHGAMASLRVMGTCMAIGEAAGTAAGLCLKRGCLPAGLAGTEVGEVLAENDAMPEI